MESSFKIGYKSAVTPKAETTDDDTEDLTSSPRGQSLLVLIENSENTTNSRKPKGNFCGRALTWVWHNKAKSLVYLLVPSLCFAGGYASGKTSGGSSQETHNKDLLSRNISKPVTTALNQLTTNYGEKSPLSTLSPETTRFIENAISSTPSFFDDLADTESPDWFKGTTPDPSSDMGTANSYAEISVRSGQKVKCPNDISLIPASNTTQWGTDYDQRAFSQDNLGSCSYFMTVANQFECFQEGIRIGCEPWLKEIYEECRNHQNVVDTSSCTISLNNFKARHEELYNKNEHGIANQMIYGWLSSHSYPSKPYEPEINQQIHELDGLGIHCLNGTVLGIGKSVTSEIKRGLHTVSYLYSYKVTGLEQCHLNLDESHPRTGDLCQPLLLPYFQYRESQSHEPAWMNGTSLNEYQDLLRDLFFKEQWSPARLNALSLAQQDSDGFSLSQYLPAFLRGLCTPVDDSIT